MEEISRANGTSEALKVTIMALPRQNNNSERIVNEEAIAEAKPRRSRLIPILCRLSLGLIFFVMGLNGFLHFIPVPEMPLDAQAFMQALAETGYLLSTVKAIEVMGGALLLLNLFVPLALLLLAPGVVNILLFHWFLAPSGLPAALIIAALELYLGFVVYRDRFASVLRP